MGAGTGAGAEADDGPESVLSLGRGTVGGALFTLASLLKGPTGSLVGVFTGLGAGALGCGGTGGGGGLYENDVGNTGAGGTMGAGLAGAGGITGGAEGADGTGGTWGRAAFGSGGSGLLAAGGGGGAGGSTYTEMFLSGL